MMVWEFLITEDKLNDMMKWTNVKIRKQRKKCKTWIICMMLTSGTESIYCLFVTLCCIHITSQAFQVSVCDRWYSKRDFALHDDKKQICGSTFMFEI
jgi:hypothetical protein